MLRDMRDKGVFHYEQWCRRTTSSPWMLFGQWPFSTVCLRSSSTATTATFETGGTTNDFKKLLSRNAQGWSKVCLQYSTESTAIAVESIADEWDERRIRVILKECYGGENTLRLFGVVPCLKATWKSSAAWKSDGGRIKTCPFYKEG